MARFPLLPGVASLLLVLGGRRSYPDLPRMVEEVYGRVYRPAGDGPHPAVVVLHGSGGMRPVYHEEARLLAEHGYVALLLDYYAGIDNPGYTRKRRLENWNRWMARVADAVSHLRSLSEVDRDRIGLMGFSQGAALAILSSTEIPGIRALVDYFGPGVDGWYVQDRIGYKPESMEDLFHDLPPLIILHGTMDFTVPASSSRKLHAELRKRGRTVELHIYEGGMHAFNDTGSFLKSPAEHSDNARAKVLDFLDRHLRGNPQMNDQRTAHFPVVHPSHAIILQARW